MKDENVHKFYAHAYLTFATTLIQFNSIRCSLFLTKKLKSGKSDRDFTNGGRKCGALRKCKLKLKIAALKRTNGHEMDATLEDAFARGLKVSTDKKDTSAPHPRFAFFKSKQARMMMPKYLFCH